LKRSTISNSVFINSTFLLNSSNVGLADTNPIIGIFQGVGPTKFLFLFVFPSAEVLSEKHWYYHAAIP